MTRDPDEVAEEAKRLRADGLAVEEVARRIGVAPSTLYRHYFPEIGGIAGRPGRRAHVATDELRAVVRRLIHQGSNHTEIARAIGVSAPTLRKHYSAQLGRATERSDHE